MTPPPATLMVALFVPTDAPLRLTAAAMVPFPEPDVGLRTSQDELLLAVQLPLEVTVNHWFAGSAPPWRPE